MKGANGFLKDAEVSGSGPFIKTPTHLSYGSTEEYNDNSPGQVLVPVTPEYDARLLTTAPFVHSKQPDIQHWKCAVRVCSVSRCCRGPAFLIVRICIPCLIKTRTENPTPHASTHISSCIPYNFTYIFGLEVH
jgi:hypothetical protein